MTTTTYPTSAMTGASAPSPYVASASSTFSTFAAWYAFDKVVAENNRWASGFGAMPNWLKIDLGSAITINRYRLHCYSPLDVTTQAPKDFTLEGSNNDSTWTTLDTRTGITGWVDAEKSFTVSSPGAYRYYRLNTTANNGSILTTVSEFYLDFVEISADARATGRGASIAACTHKSNIAGVTTGRGSSSVARTTSIASAPRSTGRGSSSAGMTKAAFAAPRVTGRGSAFSDNRYGINGSALTLGRGSANAGATPGALLHPITLGRGSCDVLSEADHGDPKMDAWSDGRGSSTAGMRKTVTSAHAVSMPALVAAFRADPVAAAAGKTRDLWASTLSPRVYDDIRGYIGGRHRGRLPFIEIEQSVEQYTQRASDLGMHPTTWDVRIHVGGLDETAAEVKARNILGAALAVLRGTGHAWLGDSNGGQFSKDPLGYVLAATIGLRNTYDPATFDTITE